MTGIDTVTLSEPARGTSVTLTAKNMDAISERLKRSDLDFDERIWDRFRDIVNELYGQVSGGTRGAGSATLKAVVGLDDDKMPVVKLALVQGSKRVGTWSASEGKQLTLEGL